MMFLPSSVSAAGVANHVDQNLTLASLGMADDANIVVPRPLRRASDYVSFDHHYYAADSPAFLRTGLQGLEPWRSQHGYTYLCCHCVSHARQKKETGG